MREILQRSRFDLPTLARLSGVTVGYLKQLSAGNQGAGEPTRRKLAEALRDHAKQLNEDADRLERGED